MRKYNWQNKCGIKKCSYNSRILGSLTQREKKKDKLHTGNAITWGWAVVEFGGWKKWE